MFGPANVLFDKVCKPSVVTRSPAPDVPAVPSFWNSVLSTDPSAIFVASIPVGRSPAARSAPAVTRPLES